MLETAFTEFAAMRHHRYFFALLLTLALAPYCAYTQVLRCEDDQGHITFTDGSCPSNQRGQEVVPAPSAEEKAAQEARYQQALERQRADQLSQAEREAAQQQADAARAAAEAARRPAPAPVIVQVPDTSTPRIPIYGPLYPPHRPHLRPPPHTKPPPKPEQPAGNFNCNVFRCYDGKGNTWSRP